MFDIADVAFSRVPEEEKKQFTANFKETGLYSGYKLRQYWVKFFVCYQNNDRADVASSTSTMESGTRSSTSTVSPANLPACPFCAA